MAAGGKTTNGAKSIISGLGSGKGLQGKDMIDFSFVAPFLSSFLFA
jgi:hypothetical protein